MNLIIKRLFDFIFSFLATLMLLPLVLLFALIMAIHFKGNPFFIQKRIGRNNIPFRIFKLRSMSNKKDKEGNLLPNEMRLTKTGNWLRKSSIDELPQLINVIFGTMSLIGPRPMGIHYLSLFSEEQKRRQNMRPGLTGWAQINGRDEVTPTEKFKLDVWYIDNFNLKLDFDIFLKTILIVFKREGVEHRASDENFPDNGSYNQNLQKN